MEINNLEKEKQVINSKEPTKINQDVKKEVLKELKKIKTNTSKSTVYDRDYWKKNLNWTHQNL